MASCVDGSSPVKARCQGRTVEPPLFQACFPPQRSLQRQSSGGKLQRSKSLENEAWLLPDAIKAMRRIGRREAAPNILDRLPEHLLHMVLAKVPYTQRTWAYCRSVCRTFRAAVPKAAKSLLVTFGSGHVEEAEEHLRRLIAEAESLEELSITTLNLHLPFEEGEELASALRPLSDNTISACLSRAGPSLRSLSLIENFRVGEFDSNRWRPACSDRVSIIFKLCPRLEHLELRCCSLMEPGEQEGRLEPLLHLRSLVLGDLGIPTEEQLQGLLVGSPALERLELVKVSAPFRELVVSGEALRELVVEDGHCCFLSLEVEAPRLVELRVLQPGRQNPNCFNSGAEEEGDLGHEREDYSLLCTNSPLLEVLEIRLADHFCLEGVEVRVAGGSIRGGAPLREVHLTCASRWEKHVFPLLQGAGATLRALSVSGSPWEEALCVPVQLDELQEYWPALETLSLDCSLVTPSLEAACMLGVLPDNGSPPRGGGSEVGTTSSDGRQQPWRKLEEVVLVQGRYARSLVPGLLHDFLLHCPALKMLRLELQCCYSWRLESANMRGRFEVDVQRLRKTYPQVDIVVVDPKAHSHSV